MKFLKFIIVISLCLQYGCTSNSNTNFSMSWDTIKSKGAHSKLTLLVERADKVDYLVLNQIFKMARDSFGLVIRPVFADPNEISGIVLRDSKRGKKSVYDLIIASQEIQENLDKLGLLYSNFHGAIPNYKNIDAKTRFLQSSNSQRIFKTPVFKRCQIFAVDSCIYPELPSRIDPEKIRVLNSAEALRMSYLISLNKDGSADQELVTDNYLKLFDKKLMGDTLLVSLRSKIVQQNKLKDGNDALYVMSPYSLRRIGTNTTLTALKSNRIPCLYTYAAITNNSDAVFGALLLINLILDEHTQLTNYDLSEGYYMPLVKSKIQR